jgi:hypothetical protein
MRGSFGWTRRCSRTLLFMFWQLKAHVEHEYLCPEKLGDNGAKAKHRAIRAPSFAISRFRNGDRPRTQSD